LLTAGCGASGDAPSRGEPDPDPGRAHDDGELQRRTFARAEDECSIFSPAAVAREYGGDASDLGSVAAAYARETTQSALADEARRGCLAGLLK
jgi:hypothetical protein